MKLSLEDSLSYLRFPFVVTHSDRECVIFKFGSPSIFRFIRSAEVLVRNVVWRNRNWSWSLNLTLTLIFRWRMGQDVLYHCRKWFRLLLILLRDILLTFLSVCESCFVVLSLLSCLNVYCDFCHCVWFSWSTVGVDSVSHGRGNFQKLILTHTSSMTWYR
jgi:hypothetical protein